MPTPPRCTATNIQSHRYPGNATKPQSVRCTLLRNHHGPHSFGEAPTDTTEENEQTPDHWHPDNLSPEQERAIRESPRCPECNSHGYAAGCSTCELRAKIRKEPGRCPTLLRDNKQCAFDEGHTGECHPPHPRQPEQAWQRLHRAKTQSRESSKRFHPGPTDADIITRLRDYIETFESGLREKGLHEERYAATAHVQAYRAIRRILKGEDN